APPSSTLRQSHISIALRRPFSGSETAARRSLSGPRGLPCRDACSQFRAVEDRMRPVDVGVPHAKYLRFAPQTACLGIVLLGAVALTSTPVAGQHDPHPCHAAPGAPRPPQPPPLPEQPPAGLKQDPLDAPSATSVEDAARAAAIAAEMGSGHHAGHGSYSHVDAGRVPATSPAERQRSAPPPASPHAHHSHHPTAGPSPSPSPTARPSPPPKKEDEQ